MTPFRRDPYLWIHLAGLATLPLWLDFCLASLAVGNPVIPSWIELGGVGLMGSAPIFWMQWQRPFYIFSLLVIAIQPDTLSEDRRRLLSLQRHWSSRLSVLVSRIGLLLGLAFLYQLAPIAVATTPFSGQSPLVSWLICALSFLFANLFVQVPATVVPLLLTSGKKLSQAQPYESASILKDFTVIGLRVPRILPELAATTLDPSSDTSVSEPDPKSLEQTSDSPVHIDMNDVLENGDVDITQATANLEASDVRGVEEEV